MKEKDRLVITFQKGTGITCEPDSVPAEIEGDKHTWWYVCGECHTAIDWKDKFCRECGCRISWKEVRL